MTAPLFLIAELPAASAGPTSITGVLLQISVVAGPNLLVIVAFIALALLGNRISLLLAFGTGLLAAALGALIHLGAGANPISAALSSLGAIIAEPMALALIAAVTPRRTAAAAFAAWITLQSVVPSRVPTEAFAPPSLPVILGLIGCAIAGIALVVRGRALEGTLFPTLATPIESAPTFGTARVSKRTRAARVSKRTGTDPPPDPE